MTIEETIKKAIEGGYKKYQVNFLLDPSFWKCLGKAMGWKESASENIDSNWYHIEEWKARWHGFVHTLTEGGTAEEFFKELE